MAELPTRAAIKTFIREQGGRVGKREIARHFKIDPEDKAALREILKALAQDGAIAPAGHKRFTEPGRLPETSVVQIFGTDPDGDPIARPVGWEGHGPPPLVLMRPEPRGQPALAPGERVLARLKPIGQGKYEGRTLKRLSDTPARILGVFRAPDRLIPTDRRAKAEWRIPPGQTLDAQPGEIILAEPLPGTGFGLKPAQGHRAPWQHRRRPLGQPDLHPHARHSDGIFARGRSTGQTRPRHPRSRNAPICATRHSSPSTARMPATSTMRSTPNRTVTGSA